MGSDRMTEYDKGYMDALQYIEDRSESILTSGNISKGAMMFGISLIAGIARAKRSEIKKGEKKDDRSVGN